MYIVEFVIVLIMCAISAMLGIFVSKRFPTLKQLLMIAGFVFIAINVFIDVHLGRWFAAYFSKFTSRIVFAGSFFLLGVIGVYYRKTLSQKVLHDLFFLVLVFLFWQSPLGSR